MARYLAAEKELTVWSSTQIPHMLKSIRADAQAAGESDASDRAGSRGKLRSKLNVYAEEGLLGYLALKLNCTVKWTEERSENFQATIHGRGQVGEVEAAVKKDGTILGLRYKVIADIGAYHQLFTPAIPPFTGLMLSGCYKIPAIGMELTAVFTNKMSTDAYRGAGRPEATFVIERMLDRIAQELGIDPVKVRRKNFLKPAEFPFKTATGLAYDSGNYELALSRALRLAGYEKLRRDQKRLRNQGNIWGSACRPTLRSAPWDRRECGSTARCRWSPMESNRLVRRIPAWSGAGDVLAQIVADELGVELMIYGDPWRHGRCAQGHRHFRQPGHGGRRNCHLSIGDKGQRESARTCVPSLRGGS